MADHRPDIYLEPDRIVLRASSLGFCDKRLVAAGLGYEQLDVPDWLQRAFDEGSDSEDRVLGMFENADRVEGPWPTAHGATGNVPQWFRLDPTQPTSYRVHRDATETFPWCRHEYLDDDQFTVELPCGKVEGKDVVVRGHMDAVGQCFAADRDSGWLGRRVVEEAKLLGPDGYKKWLRHGWSAFGYYATQVSVYHYATGLPVAFVVGQKVRTGDSDGDANGPSTDSGLTIPNVHVTMVDADTIPVKLGVIKARALRLARMVAKGELPVCTSADYPCPVNYLHDEADAEAGGQRKRQAKKDAGVREVEVRDAEVSYLADRVNAYNRHAREEAVAKQYKKDAAAEIAKILAPYKADREKVTVTNLPDGMGLEWVVRHTEAGTREVKESWAEYPKVTSNFPTTWQSR